VKSLHIAIKGKYKMIEEKDKCIDEKIVEQNKRIQEKDNVLDEKDSMIAEKDKRIMEKDQALEEKDNALERPLIAHQHFNDNHLMSCLVIAVFGATGMQGVFVSLRIIQGSQSLSTMAAHNSGIYYRMLLASSLPVIFVSSPRHCLSH
jgi:hypothetical protein